MKYASVGSISHGTLRSEDLLDSFADEIEDHVTRNPELELELRESLTKLVWDAREMLDVPEDDRGQVWEMSATDIVSDLIDALETFAPPYCYFGTHEGDGSDFGFWPSLETIDELPHVENSDEARELGEDCKFVNDHGNVTVYGGDGSIILELV